MGTFPPLVLETVVAAFVYLGQFDEHSSGQERWNCAWTAGPGVTMEGHWTRLGSMDVESLYQGADVCLSVNAEGPGCAETVPGAELADSLHAISMLSPHADYMDVCCP